MAHQLATSILFLMLNNNSLQLVVDATLQLFLYPQFFGEPLIRYKVEILWMKTATSNDVKLQNEEWFIKMILLSNLTTVYSISKCRLQVNAYAFAILNQVTCSSSNHWDLEHRSIFIVTASITIHKEPNTVAAVVTSNNGIWRSINHSSDIRILFLNHSFCFLALLSHQLRPEKLIASYKCTSFGGLDMEQFEYGNMISKWIEKGVWILNIIWKQGLMALGVGRIIGLANPFRMVWHGCKFFLCKVLWKMWSETIFILKNVVDC